MNLANLTRYELQQKMKKLSFHFKRLKYVIEIRNGNGHGSMDLLAFIID